MTPNQTEKLKLKIFTIKKMLTAEKRMVGAYDDSNGLRYLPPGFFIRLQDFKSALSYLKWFSRNFSGDCDCPGFLFEWTIILFSSGEIKEAQKKAFETFCADTHLFSNFFEKATLPSEKLKSPNVAVGGINNSFKYISKQPELASFSECLNNLRETQNFKSCCIRYLNISKQLETESNPMERLCLIIKERQLKDTM